MIKEKNKMKRGKYIRVIVDSNPPYIITDMKMAYLGRSAFDGKGIYMKNAQFVISKGLPMVVGVYLGDIDGAMVIRSQGNIVNFDEDKNAFIGQNGPIRKANMVQVYDGLIKAVIEG